MMPRVASYLAFDIGAESGRAVVGTLDGGMLGLREVGRFPNVPVHVGTSLRWDVEAIWRGVEAGLVAAVGDRPASIGVDTWGCDYGLVDRTGALLEPPYHYRDRRTEGVMARVLARVGRERVYATTGVQCLPFNTLYQLVAARETTPEILEAADALLTMPDLVNHRLTGRMTTEFTNATTTQCVDARTGQWAEDLLAELDLPLHLFRPIADPGTVIGTLWSAAAPALNGTPVVLPASHDTGSAFASVATGGETAFLSCGTWSLLGTELTHPVITPRSREANFTNEGGAYGTWRLLKNIGGLWLLQACRRSWEAAGDAWSYEDLVDAARDDAHAFRAIVDPDDPSFLSPDDMVQAIASYCVRTGQPVPAGPPGYTRAILESLAIKYRVVLEALEKLTGRSFHTIRIAGGGARNVVLNQFTADATGRTVLAGPVEATALGNIAVQMVATGAVRSLADAREIIARSFPPDRYEPRPRPGWDAALARLTADMR
jgi:rhamnulokinase